MGAEEETCETCGVGPGSRCVTASGRPTGPHAARMVAAGRRLVEVRECIIHGWTTAWSEDDLPPTGFSCDQASGYDGACGMPVSETAHMLRIQPVSTSESDQSPQASPESDALAVLGRLRDDEWARTDGSLVRLITDGGDSAVGPTIATAQARLDAARAWYAATRGQQDG